MPIADRVVAEALTWKGTPWHHQARLKGAGVDCLNLVVGVYEAVTGKATEKQPPYSIDWAESGNGELMLEAANKYLIPVFWEYGTPFEAGQVIIFRYRKTSAAKHAAIVVSPTEMLHTYNGLNTQVVTISRFWLKQVAGVFNFPEV